MAKKINIFALLIAALLFSPGLFASDNLAKDIQEKYKAINDLSADFYQSTYVEVLGSTIKERGRFFMKKPGLLRIEYEGEYPKQYISDGKKLWVVSKELDQVEIYSVSKGSITKEGLELLKGFSTMSALFKIETMESKTPEKGHTYLKLTPKTPSPQYKWLACDFGPDNVLKTMTIYNKSGNVSTYTFANIRTNEGLDKGIFTYK